MNQQIEDQLKLKIAGLMKRRDEILAELKQIESEISKDCPSIAEARVLIGENKIGRPKGSCNRKSLDTIILETIYNSSNGVNVNEIATNIAKEGYVSTASPSDFINIIRSRLSVLKRNKKIQRCENNMTFRKLD